MKRKKSRPKLRIVTARVDSSLLRELDKFAASNKMTRSAMIEHILAVRMLREVVG